VGFYKLFAIFYSANDMNFLSHFQEMNNFINLGNSCVVHIRYHNICNNIEKEDVNAIQFILVFHIRS